MNNVSISQKGFHIAENPNLFEVAKSNAFELIIPDDLKLVKPGSEQNADSVEYFDSADVQNVIRIAVDSVSVPNFSLGTIEVKRGNSTIKFAGTPTWEAGSIKLTDFVGARVKDILYALKAQVYDATRDVVNLATVYKHDWTLVEYTGDFSKVVRTWTLKGCWIKDVKEDEFSHENADGKRQITATVEYDRALLEMSNL